jgi:hypothetical protein
MTDPRGEAHDEARFKVGDQWYYRGNRSPSWFFVASRADGSCQGGIAERVPVDWWPLLEEIASLRSATPANARAAAEKCAEICEQSKWSKADTLSGMGHNQCLQKVAESIRVYAATLEDK